MTDKPTIRAAARQRRAVLHAARTGLDPAPLLDAVPFDSDTVVAGYAAIGTELDVFPLLDVLAARGVTLALPSIDGGQRILRFRRWRPGETLVAGPLNVPTPLLSAPEIFPTVVLVPMLAFDRTGHRLGYGGGYYDATLQHLRQGGALLAVGVAFAGQEVEQLPAEPLDQRLDWILTEQGLRQVFPKERR